MTDLAVARKAFRDALRPRRLLTALLLVLLPAVVAALTHALTPAGKWMPSERYDEFVVLLVFGFTLTILSVVYGTGVIADELEQRTIVFLLIRPLPRWRILLARFLVSIVLVAIVAVLSTLLLAVAVFGPAHVGDAGLGPDLRALIAGSVSYGAVFLLLGAILPRPLIYGLLFVFGWEDIITFLPGSFARLSLMSYLRVIASRDIGGDAAASSSAPGGNPTNFLFNLGHGPAIDITLHEAYTILGIVTVVALAAAMWAFSTREYVPREEGD